jgi:sugar lactone lactonase YvrE
MNGRSLWFMSIMLCCLALACTKNPQDIPPQIEKLTVSAINPDHGGEGIMVSVKGKGFLSVGFDSILINGKALVFSDISDTTFTVVIPSLVGTGNIEVFVDGERIDGPVFTYDTAIFVTTFAGAHEAGSIDGTGMDARFNGPEILAMDSHDNLFVAEAYARTIRKITPEGVVTRFAGHPTEGGIDDGPRLGARFLQIMGLAFDADDNLFVSEYGGGRLRKISSDGTVSTLIGSISGNVDGPASLARLYYPAGLVTDTHNNLLIADFYSIRKLNELNNVSTVAGTGKAGGDDGPALQASFWAARNIARDVRGDIFIVDNAGHSIRKMTNGVVSTFAGFHEPGFANGQGQDARFMYPNSIATDMAGNIYVSDLGNNAIRKITPDGWVSLYAGGGAGEVDGPARVATLRQPTGLAVDSKGNVFVADMANNKIRKISVE